MRPWPRTLKLGFYNHCFCPIGPEGPAYCIWEVREDISAEEFQEFIDGPNGVNFGLGAWMNICREINLSWLALPLTRGSFGADSAARRMTRWALHRFHV